MSIYNDIIDVEKLLDQCYDLETGEVNENKEQELLALRDELIKNGAEKLCKAWASINSDYEGLKAEAKRIDAAMKRAIRKIEFLENNIMWIYSRQPEEKLKAGTFTISIRKSTQVKVDDDFNNENYLIITETRKPDKVAIKEALKAGEVIDGAELIINQNLTIK
jgi:hypothetical protein